MKKKDTLVCWVLIIGLLISFMGCENWILGTGFGREDTTGSEPPKKSEGLSAGEDYYDEAQRASWPFEYIGSFNVPDDSGFSYAHGGLAYNPAGNNGSGSLFMGGHDWHQEICEITIPQPVIN